VQSTGSVFFPFFSNGRRRGEKKWVMGNNNRQVRFISPLVHVPVGGTVHEARYYL
jgi:hypothetical protein